LGELDSRIRDQLPNEVRDENLPTKRLAGDPRSEVDCRAEEAVSLLDRVARVNADPDPNRGGVIGERCRYRALDRLRTTDCAPRARKRKHRAVPLRLDDGAAVGSRHVTDQRVVASEHITPGMVDKARGEDSRIDDVGEDDRDRAVNGESREEIWSLALDASLERIEAYRELLAVEIHIPHRRSEEHTAELQS